MEGRGYIHHNKSASSGPNAEYFEAHNAVTIAFTEWKGYHLVRESPPLNSLPSCLKLVSI
jgi:hypothetical protein